MAEIKQNEFFPSLFTFCGILCLIAIYPFNSYYFLLVLRFTVFLTSLYLLYLSLEKDNFFGLIVYLILAIIFNPIKLLHFDRVIWVTIDSISAIIFFVSAVNFGKSEPVVLNVEYAKMIQEEYLKAEHAKKEAEEEKVKANWERNKAERLFEDAQREWEKIQERIKNLSNEELKDPYAILGVHRTDSLEKIKEVYRNLVKTYHPDKHPDVDDNSKKQKSDLLARINESYNWILKNHPAK